MKDVFVVGAGLAGISCALALVRHGVSTVVLEHSHREHWLRHIDSAASQMPECRALDEVLDLRFGFAVDRLSRIDGSSVLVAWSGDTPVIARYGVLAVGATGARAFLPLSREAGRRPDDMRAGRSGVADLFVCGDLALPQCGPLAAWQHGQDVARRLLAADGRDSVGPHAAGSGRGAPHHTSQRAARGERERAAAPIAP